jgi:uncharacterized protein (TIGR04255 family)
MMVPTRITPCPIAEAIAEVRFSSDFPKDAVFGVLYNGLKAEFRGEAMKLPILQLPEVIRSQDPQLAFQPYYRVNTGPYILQLGPSVLSVSAAGEYPGWTEFSVKIAKTIDLACQSGAMKRVSRVALRYINFFEFNVFEKINLTLQMKGAPFNPAETTMRSLLDLGHVKSNLMIANNAKVGQAPNQKTGSVVDIDTFKEVDQASDAKALVACLAEVHEKEKELFFGIMKDDYVAGLSPEFK